MAIPSVKQAIVSSFLLLAVSPVLKGQVPVYKPGEYPAPRYPKLKASYTIEDLMPIAREVVRRPVQGAFLKAGYAIQPGQKALLVVSQDFDRLVLDALSRAIREAGGQVDHVLTDPGQRPPGGDGSLETRGILESIRVSDEGVPIIEGKGITSKTVVELAVNNGYDLLIYGSGGPHAQIKIPWQYIFWDRIDKFVTGAGYPDELQQAIDKAAWEVVLQSHRVRVRDPEGTDMSWTVKPNYWEEAKQTYQFNIVHEGHISAIPLGMAIDSFMESDAQGVISGTLNHTGPFPQIRVSISKASAAGIEGGGKYGQNWREALAKWKDVQWPGHPGPGINKLWEVAIGTNVRGIRPKDSMDRPGGNVWERSRSGIIHWGIGARTAFVMAILMPGGDFQKFREEHHAPAGHVHVHTFFNNMEIETGNGQRLQLINKGHLTVLDDPKVRQVAAKYGDPDELLREIWIPAIPGINVPGDYQNDYASDPTAYIRKEIAANYKY